VAGSCEHGDETSASLSLNTSLAEWNVSFSRRNPIRGFGYYGSWFAI
jgi:hypothetical protein